MNSPENNVPNLRDLIASSRTDSPEEFEKALRNQNLSDEALTKLRKEEADEQISLTPEDRKNLREALVKLEGQRKTDASLANLESRFLRVSDIFGIQLSPPADSTTPTTTPPTAPTQTANPATTLSGIQQADMLRKSEGISGFVERFANKAATFLQATPLAHWINPEKVKRGIWHYLSIKPMGIPFLGPKFHQIAQLKQRMYSRVDSVKLALQRINERNPGRRVLFDQRDSADLMEIPEANLTPKLIEDVVAARISMQPDAQTVRITVDDLRYPAKAQAQQRAKQQEQTAKKAKAAQEKVQTELREDLGEDVTVTRGESVEIERGSNGVTNVQYSEESDVSRIIAVAEAFEVNNSVVELTGDAPELRKLDNGKLGAKLPSDTPSETVRRLARVANHMKENDRVSVVSLASSVRGGDISFDADDGHVRIMTAYVDTVAERGFPAANVLRDITESDPVAFAYEDASWRQNSAETPDTPPSPPPSSTATT